MGVRICHCHSLKGGSQRTSRTLQVWGRLDSLGQATQSASLKQQTFVGFMANNVRSAGGPRAPTKTTTLPLLLGFPCASGVNHTENREQITVSPSLQNKPTGVS